MPPEMASQVPGSQAQSRYRAPGADLESLKSANGWRPDSSRCCAAKIVWALLAPDCTQFAPGAQAPDPRDIRLRWPWRSRVETNSGRNSTRRLPHIPLAAVQAVVSACPDVDAVMRRTWSADGFRWTDRPEQHADGVLDSRRSTGHRTVFAEDRDGQANASISDEAGNDVRVGRAAVGVAYTHLIVVPAFGATPLCTQDDVFGANTRVLQAEPLCARRRTSVAASPGTPGSFQSSSMLLDPITPSVLRTVTESRLPRRR